MWEQIWNAAVNTGLWAMLFIGLFFVQLKDSKAREEKYQATIASLADKMDIINDINEKLDEIKAKKEGATKE